MKTNKLFLFPLIFLLFVSLASAGLFPQIISGKVTLDEQIYEGLAVEITGNGQTFTLLTDASGYYTVEVGSPGAYRIQVCEGDPKCVREVYLQDSIPLMVNFEFTGFELKTTYFYIGGLSILGIAVIVLAGLFKKKKCEACNLSKALVEEVLQNAENVALGKLKDVGDLSGIKHHALEYELAHKERTRIIRYLR